MQILQGRGNSETKQKFGDIKQMHFEFRLPVETRHLGQYRANSGLFLNGAYEIQLLDSFGRLASSGDGSSSSKAKYS